MNAKQEAKLNMFRAVEKQCDDNPAIVSKVPAFQNALNKFKPKVAEIIATTQQSDLNISGIATGKTNLKQIVCQKSADTAKIIFAYASEIGDDALKAEVNYSLTKLLKTRDDQLAPRCQNIHDRGAANVANLRDYGITAATLTDLQTAIDDYAVATPKPRTAASRRKTLNANLVTLFRETTGILVNQMDNLISAFKTTDPDFVREYESNREIVDPPTKPRKPKPPADKKTTKRPNKSASLIIAQ